jgi:hypothetical protein
VLNSQGPVAALQYAVTAIVNIPVDAVKALAGAVLSNAGGPPAKADEIKVPPGSQDETNPEPSPARTAAAATVSVRTLAVAAPALTRDLSGADATPSVTDPAGPAERHTQSVASGATPLADDGKSGANAIGSTAKSPTTPDSVPTSADATDSGEPKTSTDPKDKPESKDSTEPKKSTDSKDSGESK